MDEETYNNILAHLRETILISPLTKDLTVEEAERIFKEKEIYKETKTVDNFLPYTLYEILKNLSSDEQKEFLEDNIEFIKEHDEEIFLYNLHSPTPLSSHFDFSVIKKIYDLDKDIFTKILKINNPHRFDLLSFDDFFLLFSDYSEIIESLEEQEFIHLFFSRFDKLYQFSIVDKDILEQIKEKELKCDNYIKFIFSKYNNKIKNFSIKNIFSIFTKINDSKMLEEFFLMYKEDFYSYINKFEFRELKCFLEDLNFKPQIYIFKYFFELFLSKFDINDLIYCIPLGYINIYSEKYKEDFDKISLSNWIKALSRYEKENDIDVLLDKFNDINLEEVYNEEYFSLLNYSRFYVIKYIEKKYRDNEVDNLTLDEINEDTSIFSNTYVNNLMKLKVLLKNKSITYDDELYKKHLLLIVLYLKKKNKIDNLNDDNFKVINKLFLKIIRGESLTILFNLSSIEEIALYNRLGSIEFKANELSIGQIEKFNVKHFKYLCKNYADEFSSKEEKTLFLKLMLLVGFNNAKFILSLDNKINTLEHLVGNVFVKNIKMDENGNPILNKKIMHLLFNDKSIIKNMLEDKESKLYEFFPRIFNDWGVLTLDKKNTLKEILDYLNGSDYTPIPKYNALNKQFKYLGTNGNIISETYNLYDNMLKRTSSTIPRISGNVGEYSYEVLKLQDVNGISIGNRTKCCFTVLGNAYSSLKHAITNKDGRILEIKKDGKLIAQSWLWRNGNTLCIDNIETNKTLESMDFIEVYHEFSKHIVNVSNVCEEKGTSLKNVTLGYTSFDKPIKNVDDYLSLVTYNYEINGNKRNLNNKKIVTTLPRPKEIEVYTDSKNAQILLYGIGDFKYYDVDDIYQDNREDILFYEKSNEYEKDTQEKLENIVNALRYRKNENEDTLDKYKKIRLKDYDKIYCNKDWYVLIKDNEIESFIYSYDDRAFEEIEQHKNIMEKKLVKVI